MTGPIMLFDGVCKFCDAGVNFIIDHDRRGRIRFAPLQGPTGQALLRRFGLKTEDFNSMALVEGNRCLVKSTAALRLAAYLDGPWSLLSVLVCVPPPMRDFAYDIFVRNRYRWFGRLDACRVPTPELRQRFLD